MADIIDQANDAADTFLNAALRNQQQRATIAARSTGFCLSCGAAAEAGKRWCDADCRDDWERTRGR